MYRIHIALLVSAGCLAAGSTPASASPKRVEARTAAHAASMEVEDPDTEICVKRPVTNSRIRSTRDCRTSSAWKAYQDEIDATQRAMNNNR